MCADPVPMRMQAKPTGAAWLSAVFPQRIPRCPTRGRLPAACSMRGQVRQAGFGNNGALLLAVAPGSAHGGRRPRTFRTSAIAIEVVTPRACICLTTVGTFFGGGVRFRTLDRAIPGRPCCRKRPCSPDDLQPRALAVQLRKGISDENREYLRGLDVLRPADRRPGYRANTFGDKAADASVGGLSCNLVADVKADPECAAYLKQRSQNLTPSPLQATEEATGEKK